MVIKRLFNQVERPVNAAPLAMFRILFGGIMLVSIIRFVLNGWVKELYIDPVYYFTFYGFEWVKPLEAAGMYTLFALMIISAAMVMLGWFYRIAAPLLFLTFTYVELIDKTNYLNHYYFVSIVAFLMILVPAHHYFSMDVCRGAVKETTQVPAWSVHIFKLQLGVVYFYAGIAKLHADWLLEAMPLRIWLPANAHLPVIGPFLDYVWVAYLFSWFGALYDLTIPFFLLNKRTRPWAYMAVVVFHLLTRLLFPIGMFPYIMILATLVFFSESFHQRVINKLKLGLAYVSGKKAINAVIPASGKVAIPFRKSVFALLLVHFALQLVLPFRYALYPDSLFWTEQGYRFSWRVMLMEKAGYVTFYIKDPGTGREGEVAYSDYLSPNQIKMMSTQPDMILQFAHFLAEEYRKQGIKNPEIRAESYVTLNGRGSRLYLDPTVNLVDERESFKHKTWILPYLSQPAVITDKQ
jgi:hypothetical protein